jgi:hypothetical protein
MESKVSILSPRVEFAKTDMPFPHATFQKLELYGADVKR